MIVFLKKIYQTINVLLDGNLNGSNNGNDNNNGNSNRKINSQSPIRKERTNLPEGYMYSIKDGRLEIIKKENSILGGDLEGKIICEPLKPKKPIIKKTYELITDPTCDKENTNKDPLNQSAYKTARSFTRNGNTYQIVFDDSTTEQGTFTKKGKISTNYKEDNNLEKIDFELIDKFRRQPNSFLLSTNPKEQIKECISYMKRGYEPETFYTLGLYISDISNISINKQNFEKIKDQGIQTKQNRINRNYSPPIRIETLNPTQKIINYRLSLGKVESQDYNNQEPRNNKKVASL